METISVQQPINLKVVKFELNFTPFYHEQPKPKNKRKEIKVPNIKYNRRRSFVPSPPLIRKAHDKRDAKDLVEELLDELYADQRDWSNNSSSNYRRGSTIAPSLTSTQSHCREHPDAIERNYLETLDIDDLRKQFIEWNAKLQDTGERLGKYVRVRDRFRRQQKKLCTALTVLIRHITGDNNARFGLTPGAGEGPGEGGYAEWLHAMRLVAKLPAGVPQHFRKKLWLTLSDRYLSSRGIDWPAAERACFRGTAQPDDTELGAQIIKDLHRTGCSLFCGTEGRENQAMLRRVLLAYARWNKEVGYCQGFNMLAAIILEVMDKSESDSLKVMVYLVEAVLPEGYFADDLRGLSADMAAFRDLLRLRLPRLASHMDYLQRISDGGGVEPPLPDVFTMQWFLTLYATWLQRDCLLRIWDLILLDGNEVLLLTALAIWDLLQDRILSARSADEFYSCMGGGAGVIWQAGEALVARVVGFGSAPELPRLRSLHRYRVTPPAPPTTAPVYHPPVHSAMQSVTKKGLRLFYSEDEGDSSDDGNKMALATVLPKRDERIGAGDRLSLDIGALKRQYARLRERQRQAHVILAAACARHAAVGVSTSPTSLTVNNLLLGKSAIVSSRGRRLGPPPGAIPPTRQVPLTKEKTDDSSAMTKQSTDTICWKEEKHKKSLSRRNSMKWKDLKKENVTSNVRKASIDLDEAGDGVIVSEHEANELIASLRSRSSSESSSYSSHSSSSTDTSLCDENERVSDSESELPIDEGKVKVVEGIKKSNFLSSPYKETTLISPKLKESKIAHSPEDKQIPNIADYLDSAAGESLRAYIDGFQAKLEDSENKHDNRNNDTKSPYKHPLPFPSKINSDKTEVLQILSKPEYDINLTSCEKIRPSKITTTFTDLSPLDISPSNFGLHHKSPYNYCLKSNQQSPSISQPSNTGRPLDIIESFTMYPDFVPDIDLTEKKTLHQESPSRSPGAESIVVSEDEPPIPLKIDKYFEHSPEFFGARVTDPNSLEIPNRRAPKRLSRLPKKPDSLTLQSSHNERLIKNYAERASSLPQSHSFSKIKYSDSTLKEQNLEVIYKESLLKSPKIDSNFIKLPTPDKVNTHLTFSPKGNIFEFGRKNSERALQIIQENSKILSRILTKQTNSEKYNVTSNFNNLTEITDESAVKVDNTSTLRSILEETKSNTSPLLKESTSDSLIGIKKRYSKTDKDNDKNDFVRIRPISIDDPFSLEVRTDVSRNKDFSLKNIKSPSSECIGNKTDFYGWENKGFLAKCDYNSTKLSTPKIEYRKKSCDITSHVDSTRKDLITKGNSEWRHSFSGESKTSMTLPSNEQKDVTYDCRYMSDDYKNYFLSNRYNDFVLTEASDICSKTADKGPKVCENLSKTDVEHNSDFTHVVTSSISFTYEHSIEQDSPVGAKSNSSDTLCQIMSLDQVSTPISPKIFSNRDTPTIPKDSMSKIDTLVSKIDSDETCSAITSILDTDTLSSLSHPRSPSSGSYHFPARPAMRLPKELTVRLGMYPKDTLSSPRN